MKNLFLLVFFGCLALFTSCLKFSSVKPTIDNNCQHGCYIITGRVIDTPGNIGLKDVTLKLYSKYAGYSFVNTTRLLTQLNTAADGSFRFSVDTGTVKLNKNYVYITLSKEGFIDDEVYPSPYYNTTWVNRPYVQNVTLFRKATLKVNLRFNQMITGYASAGITVYTKPAGTGNFLNANQFYDQQLSYTVAGDIMTRIDWGLYDAVSPHIVHQDSIMIPAGQEKTFTANFP